MTWIKELREARETIRRLTAERDSLQEQLKPFQPMTLAEAEAELAAFDASGIEAEPLIDEQIKEMVRFATGTSLEQAEMTAERYRKAYRAECMLREAAQAEVERLTLLNEDKFRHLQGYCNAANEDRARIRKLEAERDWLQRDFDMATDMLAGRETVGSAAALALLSVRAAEAETERDKAVNEAAALRAECESLRPLAGREQARMAAKEYLESGSGGY